MPVSRWKTRWNCQRDQCTFCARVSTLRGWSKLDSIKNKDFNKYAFCGPAYVEISEDGEVLKLYNEIPDGATLVNEKITKEAMKAWTLRAKEKWNQ